MVEGPVVRLGAYDDIVTMKPWIELSNSVRGGLRAASWKVYMYVLLAVEGYTKEI